MSQTRSIQDAALTEAVDLPTANTYAVSTGIDLGANNDHVVDFEVLISAPALNGTELPAAATMIYALEDSANNSSFSTVQDRLIVQTGAQSVGAAAAATKRIRLPSNIRRYFRIKATGASNGDCSGSEMTVKVLF